MRSGTVSVELSANTLNATAQIGYLWSNTMEKSISYAYFLKVYEETGDPSGGPYSRSNGIPLRCLSTALEG